METAQAYCLLVIKEVKERINLSRTCVIAPPAGLRCVAAASEAVQTQHVSSAPGSVSATVLDVSIILQRGIKVELLKKPIAATV